MAHLRSFGLLVVLCVLGGTTWAQSSIETLRKSLESRRSTVASLIQVQAVLVGGERTVTKVEYDGKGRSRRTMLQPLRLQGQVLIDDGKSLITVMSDAQTIKIVASRPISNEFRLDLIGKNYQLVSSKGEKVAGRSTIKITCRPRAKEMPSRRILVDQATSIPLRVASIYQGKETILLDTLSFETPKEMPSTLFMAPVSPRSKVIKLASTIRVKDESEASDHVYFQPWAPRSMPFGFAVESLEVLPAGKASVLAVRLTDGFNMATIYQWDASIETQFPNSGVVTSRNLRFALIGDIPDTISERLTEYLSKEAMSL